MYIGTFIAYIPTYIRTYAYSSLQLSVAHYVRMYVHIRMCTYVIEYAMGLICCTYIMG